MTQEKITKVPELKCEIKVSAFVVFLYTTGAPVRIRVSLEQEGEQIKK